MALDPFPPDPPVAMQLRIDVDGFSPPIWRRVIVPATFTFADLHEVIQTVFEWEDYHIHEFEVGPDRLGPDRGEDPLYGDVLDETQLRLADVPEIVEGKRSSFNYIYDFGDNWQHTIRIEEVLDEAPEQALPVVVKGRMAAPREDSRFEQTREAMVGGDPEAFDVDEVNARLDGLRDWWTQEGQDERAAQLAFAPPSEELVWTPGQVQTCTVCSGSTHPVDVAVHAVLEDAPDVPLGVQAWACGECGLLHAGLSALMDRLAQRPVDPARVEGFSADGQQLDAYLGAGAMPEDGQPSADQDEAAPAGAEELGFEEGLLREEDGNRVVGVPWARFREAARAGDAPAPSVDEVDSLPVAQAAWQVAAGPVAWIGDAFSVPELAYGVVVTGREGLIRLGTVLQTGPPGPEVLAEAVLRASRDPTPPLDPARPSSLVLETGLEEHAEALASALGDLEVTVETGAAELAQTAFAEFEDERLSQGPPAWLVDEAVSSLKAFFEAGEAFLDAEPWWQVPPDTFLGVRLGEDPWRYVSLMGHAGQDQGVLVFESWDAVESFMQEAQASPTATPSEPVESVSPCPVDYLHPRDAHALYEEGLLEPSAVQVLLPLRVRGRAAERPSLPLDTFTVLLEALTTGLTGKTDEDRLTVEVGDVTVEVTVPATGEETASPSGSG